MLVKIGRGGRGQLGSDGPESRSVLLRAMAV